MTSPFSLVVTRQSYNAISTSVGGLGVLLSSHETDSSVPRSLVCWNASRTADSAREEPLPKPQPARAATTTSAPIMIAFNTLTDDRSIPRRLKDARRAETDPLPSERALGDSALGDRLGSSLDQDGHLLVRTLDVGLVVAFNDAGREPRSSQYPVNTSGRHAKRPDGHRRRLRAQA